MYKLAVMTIFTDKICHNFMKVTGGGLKNRQSADDLRDKIFEAVCISNACDISDLNCRRDPSAESGAGAELSS